MTLTLVVVASSIMSLAQIFTWYFLSMSIELFNPFLTNIPISYALKTLENQIFSGVFRGYRSSCPEVFCKKGVFKNFVKLTEKHLCQNFVKLTEKHLCQNFVKLTEKHLCQSLFFDKNAKFLRTPYLIEQLQWLLQWV